MKKKSYNPVMIALDLPSIGEAERLLQSFLHENLENKQKQNPYSAPFVKVGMQLFYAAGPDLLVVLKKNGFRIFVDLKLHDIPNTVKNAAQALTQWGVDMLNVHALGGMAMMQAAREGVEKGTPAGQSRPLLLGVTILTSTDRSMMNNEMNISGRVREQAKHLAELSRQSGLDGVVCSPLEVSEIKATCGSSFLTVTPGIRLAMDTKDDQKRAATPYEARQKGADYIVVGRPITKAAHPHDAYQEVLADWDAAAPEKDRLLTDRGGAYTNERKS